MCEFVELLVPRVLVDAELIDRTSRWIGGDFAVPRLLSWQGIDMQVHPIADEFRSDFRSLPEGYLSNDWSMIRIARSGLDRIDSERFDTELQTEPRRFGELLRKLLSSSERWVLFYQGDPDQVAAVCPLQLEETIAKFYANFTSSNGEENFLAYRPL
jgi:hypothetical protein